MQSPSHTYMPLALRHAVGKQDRFVICFFLSTSMSVLGKSQTAIGELERRGSKQLRRRQSAETPVDNKEGKYGAVWLNRKKLRGVDR
jgi:hypothetical protein